MRIKLLIPVAAALAALSFAPTAHAQVTFSFSSNPNTDPLPSGTTELAYGSGNVAITTKPGATFDIFGTITNDSSAPIYILGDNLQPNTQNLGAPSNAPGVGGGYFNDWLNGGTSGEILNNNTPVTIELFSESTTPSPTVYSDSGEESLSYTDQTLANFTGDDFTTNSAEYSVSVPNPASVPEASTASGFGIGLLLLGAACIVRRRVAVRS